MLGNLLYAYPNNTDEDNLSYVIENLLFPYIRVYICEYKGADQLCGNPTADQCLFYHHIDSLIPLLPKSQIYSL